MTYGVYTKDLKAYSIGGVTLETARQYLTSSDSVIVSEKKVCNGFHITVLWHSKWRWHFYRGLACIGPLEISWSKSTYTTADKVVEEYHETEVGKGKENA